MTAVPVLQLMSRKACCLCEDAEVMLATFVALGRCTLEVQDVDQDMALAALYGMDVPVLLVQKEVRCMHRIEQQDIEVLLAEVTEC
ncbi:MAG: glutaredoxin family protein [Mariprofundaceae bacterium]|nr:glutaredoxin family protein [Mariprofundaceae bacterium]